jgi:membrane protein implicated in regulation of membrane protease activity
VIVLLWLIAAAGLLAVELHHMAFFAMFASIGCVGGAVVAAVFPHVFVAQILVAAALCAAGIPYVSRAFARRHDGNVPLGVHGGIIGASVEVVDTVTSRPGGHVRLLGETWLAVSEPPDRFDPGALARVLAVSGTTLTVGPGHDELRSWIDQPFPPPTA